MLHGFPSGSFCVGAGDGRRGTLLLRGPPNPTPPPPNLTDPDLSRGGLRWLLPGLPQQVPENLEGQVAGSMLSRMLGDTCLCW